MEFRNSEESALPPLQPNVFEVLLSLSQGPHHGFGLITDIRQRTGGDVQVGTSTLYATLQRMRRDALIEDAGEQPSPDGPPRRTFRITPQGHQALVAEAARLQRTTAAAAAILQASPARSGKD